VRRNADGAATGVLVPLAAGVCNDFFVVVRRVTGSTRWALAAAALAPTAFLGRWLV